MPKGRARFSPLRPSAGVNTSASPAAPPVSHSYAANQKHRQPQARPAVRLKQPQEQRQAQLQKVSHSMNPPGDTIGSHPAVTCFSPADSLSFRGGHKRRADHLLFEYNERARDSHGDGLGVRHIFSRRPSSPEFSSKGIFPRDPSGHEHRGPSEDNRCPRSRVAGIQASIKPAAAYCKGGVSRKRLDMLAPIPQSGEPIYTRRADASSKDGSITAVVQPGNVVINYQVLLSDGRMLSGVGFVANSDQRKPPRRAYGVIRSVRKLSLVEEPADEPRMRPIDAGEPLNVARKGFTKLQKR
jgi:hypothetical protein